MTVDKSSLLQIGDGDSSALERRNYVFWYRFKDIAGMPMWLGIYFLQAHLLRTDVHLHFVQPPTYTLGVQCCLALVALVALREQLSIPAPMKSDPLYDLMSYVGRWIFLTRHILVLQAMHQVLSFLGYALSDQWLVQTTDSMALWIGSMGTLVTIQFFALVWNDAEFKARCAFYAAQDPPQNLRRKGFVMHAPGLLIAIADVVVAKRHANLERDCPLLGSVGMLCFYGYAYIALMAVNRRITGEWPYGFLKAFKSASKWALYLVVQTIVVGAFCLFVWGLAQLPAIW